MCITHVYGQYDSEIILCYWRSSFQVILHTILGPVQGKWSHGLSMGKIKHWATGHFKWEKWLNNSYSSHWCYLFQNLITFLTPPNSYSFRGLFWPHHRAPSLLWEHGHLTHNRLMLDTCQHSLFHNQPQVDFKLHLYKKKTFQQNHFATHPDGMMHSEVLSTLNSPWGAGRGIQAD